jgi:hypothetical protein
MGDASYEGRNWRAGDEGQLTKCMTAYLSVRAFGNFHGEHCASSASKPTHQLKPMHAQMNPDGDFRFAIPAEGIGTGSGTARTILG